MFKRNKTTMIPQLEVQEDKIFDSILEYRENMQLEEPKDMDFPLPKPEDIYLKINEINELGPIDQKYITSIFNTISSYRTGEVDRFDDFLNTIKEIFEKISGSYYDLFDFSSKIAKKLEVSKENIESCYEVLLTKKNATTLDLDAETLGALGRMISYSYTKIDKYKIKDMRKLEEAVSKVITKKINIYDNFVKWCVSKSKDPKKEKITEFYKERRKEYDCLPEIIFLVNHFYKITTVNLELDKIYNQELTDDEYKFFEIAILNLHWILNSLENIKFNLICRELHRALYKRYKEKITEACNKNNDVLKPKDIIFNEGPFFQKKWNFSGKLKPIKFKTGKEIYEVTQSKTLEIKEKKPIFSVKTFGKAFKKIETFGKNIINFGKEKSNGITRVDIVRQNSNLFEFIIICIFSLNEAKQNINVELVMNDTYNGEFFLLLNEIYKFEWIKEEDTSQFHIFDLLLFNKVIKNMQKLNIEINCLDIVSFNKFLSFLYFNQAITKFNMSLFSSDFIYIPEFIYKIYSEIYMKKSPDYLKRNYDEDTYLFCDLKDMEDKIIDRLYPNFVSYISTLFDIIYNRKALTELGFNIEPPNNIRYKSKYMNAIYKFILNLFYYISKNKISKFYILSPFTDFNACTKPEINEIIKEINFSQNNKLEELTLQMRFTELESIKCFILTKLRILNIGNLDFKTFEYLCNHICTIDFNQKSSLEDLSIGLNNSITEFSTDIKKLFQKLFGVKMKELTSLTLLTNLDLSDKKEYAFLLKLLNYNWISNYIIVFDKCDDYNTDESSAALSYLVPGMIGTKLLDKKTLAKLEDVKNKIEPAYWCLKYLFNIKYIDDKRNKERNKKLIFDILKYVTVCQNPKISHFYYIKNK